MEKDDRFKLFMPPRPSTGQVSAGRSQAFNKYPGDDLKLPFDVLNHGEITDSDTVSQQVKLCSEVDEENIEASSELFSKLYKEAEKIKEWKVTVESELNQKERKLQENRKIIEAQNKLIQELQFENEKLNLKLEDEIGENKDLLKEAAASRHLCNLLKETCTHFTEKTSKYEQEKEEMKQLYEELHSNIERMTAAFDELRVQAEKDRLEMSSKLKEEAEKVEMFEKECKLEVSQKEKQISALTMERDEKDGVITDIKAQLQTSQTRIADLMAAKLHEEKMLKGSQASQEHLRAELEEAKMSLQKAEVTQQSLEAELQSTVRTLIQVTGEKEAREEECEKMKVLLAALREEFEISAANLKSLLQNEQNRLKKYEEESKLLNLELQNKSAELEEVTKVKRDKEEELSETLKEFQDLKVQLAGAAGKEQGYLKQLLALKTDLEQERVKNDQLTEQLSKASLQKEQTAQEKTAVAAQLQKLQEQQEDNKKKEENTKQLVEDLKEENDQLRNELESWEEEMAKASEEMKRKLDEKEENMNNLKKQVENKSKCNEELQQENKVLRKKLTAESKKSSFCEEKVNKLQLEMENMNKQHKETVDAYQKEIEARKVNENKLQEEVEKMRLICDEAAVTQREADVRCQHRVTELVALMEKHKNEYDKMVEEKDAEIKVCKIKQQKQQSSQRALEKELSRLKSELSSLKEQLRAEIEAKDNLVKENSLNVIPENEKKYEAQPTQSPPAAPSGGSRALPAGQSSSKKPKVFVQLDAASGSSEQPDLLSIVSEEEIFKNFPQDHPQTSQSAPKKTPPPGSALKLKPVRRIRDSGWAAVSKLDRKRKMKEVMKFFA